MSSSRQLLCLFVLKEELKPGFEIDSAALAQKTPNVSNWNILHERRHASLHESDITPCTIGDYCLGAVQNQIRFAGIENREHNVRVAYK